jgi:hypothetical protein
LHLFQGTGEFRDFNFERKVTFRGSPYELPSLINSGSVIALDTSDPGSPEIFVTSKSDRSPTAVLRFDRDGKLLGEYWHHGQIPAMYVRDLDGDGRNELVICGFDDVDDTAELSYPFIAVLDPRKITGVSESGATRGYGFGPSGAELRYLRLPVTEYNRSVKTGAGVGRMREVDGRLIFLWQTRVAGGDRYELDFVFTKSFEPLRVISSTQIHQLFEREYAAKRIPSRLDEAYLERLRGQVTSWSGERWVPVPAGSSPHR